MGPPGQPPFVNAAVLLRAAVPPERVKPVLLRPVEAAMGRVRTADRFAPRAIDLDFVAWEEASSHGDALEVPDRDLLRYAHVALPASEVAPDWMHPCTARPLPPSRLGWSRRWPASERPRRLSLTLG